MADENIYDEFKEAIPVMSGDAMDIAIDEAFAPIGQSNSELNHAVLNNRDIPNQHPIIAIEGLRDELNNIENLKTEYSDEMGFANYYPWEDGGDSKYSRIGYFVAVADRERRIKICTESDEVFGVTVVTAGFIGNQDGIPDNDDYSKYGTKKGSNCGVECGLVAHSGVVNVHCRSDVVKGSHVICDGDGYAKVVPEEDGGYGFKVIGIDWKNGEKYAVISLDASINQLHALGKEALEIRTRMTGLEKNVTTAVNAANQALSKVNEIGEVSQGVAGKVDEIANVVDKNNQQIADTTNKVNQAVQQAQQAQQVAQEISNKVVENAKVEIQQLKDDVSKAQEVANDAKSKAEVASSEVQNTKNEILSEIKTITDEQIKNINDNINNINEQIEESETNFNNKIAEELAKKDGEYTEKFIAIQDAIDENDGSITDLVTSLNKSYEKVKEIVGDNGNYTYTSMEGESGKTPSGNTVYYDGTKYLYHNGSTWTTTDDISETGLIASIAGVQKQADKNSASIDSFTEWKGKQDTAIADIKQIAEQSGAKVDLITEYISKLSDLVEIEKEDENIEKEENKIYYFIDSDKVIRFRYYNGSSWAYTSTMNKVTSCDTDKIYYTNNEGSITYYYHKNGWWYSTTDPSIAGLSKSLANLQVQSDKNGAQVNSLTTWQGETNSALTSIQQKSDANGASINSLVVNSSMYAVGPHSPAFEMMYDETQNWLPAGLVFFYPSSTQITEKYYKVLVQNITSGKYNEGVKNNTLDTSIYYSVGDKYYHYNNSEWSEVTDPSDVCYEQSFVTGNNIYVWEKVTNGYEWAKHDSKVIINNDEVPECTEGYEYWYNESGSIENYDAKTLYKWNSTIKTWNPVATYNEDRYIGQAMSLIHQTDKEISLAVKGNENNIAQIKIDSDDNESMINLFCSYTGDNYEKVADFNAIDKNDLVTTKVYYDETDKKFYYYKDEQWKSTTKSYEAGITDAIANLKMIANDKESMTQILNTYIGKSVVDAVMCDGTEFPSNAEPNVKYVYKIGQYYRCKYKTTDGEVVIYPTSDDLDTISNVVLNAVKKIDDYKTVDTWTNDLEDSTDYASIYYVKDQDKYYHWDTDKNAWLPMETKFCFIYKTTDNEAKSWTLSNSIPISFMKAISMIQSKADANGARLDILLSGDKGDSNSLAAMIAEATGDEALMQMLTQWADKSGVIEIKDEFDENTADKDKVYYAQGKESELKILTNLMLMPYDDDNNGEVKEINGLNFKANSDGSIDIWGTATSDTYYSIRNTEETLFTLPTGNYTIGLKAEGPLAAPAYIKVSTDLCSGNIFYGNPLTFSITDSTSKYHVRLKISANVKGISSENPVRIYPMIYSGDTLKEYTPPRVATTDDKEITLYYYYSNDHWLSTTDPSVAGVSNSLATLKVKSDKHGGQIEGLVKDTSELGTKLSRFTQKADGIESLVANIDKYSVGECSQAYGLNLEQANNILYDGMIFVPTKDTDETYDYVVEEYDGTNDEAKIIIWKSALNQSIDEYFTDKEKYKQYCWTGVSDDGTSINYYFYHNGTKWDLSVGIRALGMTQQFSTNHIYQWGDNAARGYKTWNDTGKEALVQTTEPPATTSGQFWYYNGSNPLSITNDETGETKVYEPKALYKCITDETDSTIKYWTKVASAKDMFNARSLSQIRQKSNEIALEVSDAKGQVATISSKVDSMGSHIALVVDSGDSSVKPGYINGDAAPDGTTSWKIGANHINLDGEITVTNTFNDSYKGKFSIYQYDENNNNQSNNYWLKADWTESGTTTTPFSVDMSGKLTATNADITGKITATDGKIGGWNITSTYIFGNFIGKTIDIKGWKRETANTPAQYSINGTDYYDVNELDQYHYKVNTADYYYNFDETSLGWVRSTTLQTNRMQNFHLSSPDENVTYWIRTTADGNTTFLLDKKGNLNARYLNLTDDIKADVGFIGNWSISSLGISYKPDTLLKIIDVVDIKILEDGSLQYSVDGTNYKNGNILQCYKYSDKEYDTIFYYYYNSKKEGWFKGLGDPNYSIELSSTARYEQIFSVINENNASLTLQIVKPGMIVTETGLFSGHQHYRTMLKGAYSGKRFMSSVGIYSHTNPNVAVELYDPTNERIHCSLKIERNDNTNGVISIYGFKQSGKTYTTSPALELRSDGVYYNGQKLAFAK